jgi:MoaA/NifB/PqqE/SkfB family radical SAM enzyme
MNSDTCTKKGVRQMRLAAQAHGLTPIETPAYLLLHVNSACNLLCQHCHVHARLNQPDDLRFSEFVKLSEELGPLELLEMTGGEPFMRSDLAEIASQFCTQNRLNKLSIVSSGYHVESTVAAVAQILQNAELGRLTIQLSLDGTARFHNRFRGDARAFDNAIQTYYGLAALQRRDARLRLHAVSTLTADNAEEIELLSLYLHERCPQLERHSVTSLRSERRNLSLRAAEPAQHIKLERRLKGLWTERERDALYRIAEPVLAWAKQQAVEQRQQIVPCKAGILSAVVHANGDVAVCETLSAHPILGNLRENSFRELWNSPQAQKARTMIRTRQCACASEQALLPSVSFQPAQLARALLKHGLRPGPKSLPPRAATPQGPARPSVKPRLPLVEV